MSAPGYAPEASGARSEAGVALALLWVLPLACGVGRLSRRRVHHALLALAPLTGTIFERAWPGAVRTLFLNPSCW